MKLVKPQQITAKTAPLKPPSAVIKEVTAEDERIFLAITSTELTPEQERCIITPPGVHAGQHEIMALHWHPEFVPMALIERRIKGAFPNARRELIIPTQHNVLMEYGGFSGVEVDCYSRGFKRKVQLLLHFENSRLQKADVLRSALAHTRDYRATQLHDFIHTIVRPMEARLQEAAAETGADGELVGFVRVQVGKVFHLLEKHADTLPQDAFKNRLLRNFLEALRPTYGDILINRAEAFLNAVKAIVKREFSPKYFYRTSEIIEEARARGAGIVIPHPEQFWPILLAEYDVDGYEVWNPQSREYTEFLISVLKRKNRQRDTSTRRLLAFMGDDTHMGEKINPPSLQNGCKASREVGVQPGWDDISIRKQLAVAGLTRADVLEEYAARLTG